jgi:hypothetical protein
MDPNFLPHHFSINRRPWEEVNGERHRDQNRETMQSHMLTAWWAPSQPLSIVLMQPWTLRNRLDLKPLYIRPHHRFHEGVAEKHETHHTDMNTARIGGETLSEPLPVAPSPPLTPSPSAIWWIGSSSPLGHGDCESDLYKTISLSLVLHRLESHEMPIMIVTICVLLMWWILCLWDVLWDAKMCMSLMYE